MRRAHTIVRFHPFALLVRTGQWPGHSMFRLVAVIAATTVLWGLATLLSRRAHGERVERGARAAATGEAALGEGQLPLAVSALREAVVLEPDRPAYRLALARALVATGLDKEALPYVNDVLRHSPVDGEANLVLARILQRTGSTDEAEAAYYRAIFGRWAPDQLQSRQHARLELVQLYRATGQTERLRSAVQELSAAFPGDRGLQIQAAGYLLDIGSVDEAARILEDVVTRFADPGDALTRLAEAELRRGHHAAAYQAALRAVAHDRTDADARTIRDRAARVLSIDPSLPRLSAAERTRRIRRLLGEAQDRLAACDVPPDATPDALALSVERWLRRPQRDSDVGYALLAAMARRLRERCPAPPADDATGLVLIALTEDNDRGH